MTVRQGTLGYNHLLARKYINLPMMFRTFHDGSIQIWGLSYIIESGRPLTSHVEMVKKKLPRASYGTVAACEVLKWTIEIQVTKSGL